MYYNPKKYKLALPILFLSLIILVIFAYVSQTHRSEPIMIKMELAPLSQEQRIIHEAWLDGVRSLDLVPYYAIPGWRPEVISGIDKSIKLTYIETAIDLNQSPVNNAIDTANEDGIITALWMKDRVPRMYLIICDTESELAKKEKVIEKITRSLNSSECIKKPMNSVPLTFCNNTRQYAAFFEYRSNNSSKAFFAVGDNYRNLLLVLNATTYDITTGGTMQNLN